MLNRKQNANYGVILTMRKESRKHSKKKHKNKEINEEEEEKRSNVYDFWRTKGDRLEEESSIRLTSTANNEAEQRRTPGFGIGDTQNK